MNQVKQGPSHHHIFCFLGEFMLPFLNVRYGVFRSHASWLVIRRRTFLSLKTRAWLNLNMQLSGHLEPLVPVDKVRSCQTASSNDSDYNEKVELMLHNRPRRRLFGTQKTISDIFWSFGHSTTKSNYSKGIVIGSQLHRDKYVDNPVGKSPDLQKCWPPVRAKQNG